MERSSGRVRRLNAKRQAQRAIERLRLLIRTLAEIEELEDVDPIGVVTIQAGEAREQYADDLLGIVAQAVSESGRNRVVEVIVTSRRNQPPQGASGAHRRQSWDRGAALTPTSAPRSASPAPS